MMMTIMLVMALMKMMVELLMGCLERSQWAILMLLIHRSITAIVRYTALNYELHKIDDDDTDVDQFVHNS